MTTAHEFTSTWVRHRRMREGLRPATVSRLEEHCRRFVRVTGDPEIREITPEHVEKWARSLRPLAASNAANHVVTIRALLRELVRRRVISEYVLEEIPRIPRPRTIPRPFTDEEVRAAWNACPDDRARGVYALAYGCGLRIGEIARLDVRDVNLSERKLYVRSGKGGHARSQTIPPWAAKVLAPLVVDVPAHTKVIRSRWGTPMNPATLSGYVSSWLRDAGVKTHAGDGKTAHAWRHTFCTRIAEIADGDLRIAQRAMGHASITTTLRYTEGAGDSVVRAAVDRLPPAA
jgi:integrase/recombinase XerD